MPDPSGSKRSAPLGLKLAALLAPAALSVLWIAPAPAAAGLAPAVDLASGLASAATARLGGRLERLRDPDAVEASGVDLSLRLGAVDSDAAIDPFLDDVPRPMLPTGFEHDGFRPREAPARQMEIRRAARSTGALDLWWSGEIDLGRQASGMLDPAASTASLSAGFDGAFSDGRSAGVSVGFDRAVADDAGALTAPTVSTYASFHPTPQSFVDLLAGIGMVDRSGGEAGPDDMADALHGAPLGFGALTFGLEHRSGRWMLAPYGRVEASALRLSLPAQASREPGGPAFYRRLSAVGGVRADYTVRSGELLVRPGLRLEVLRDLGRTGVPALGSILPATGVRSVTVTPGVRADFSPDWSARLEHRSVLGRPEAERTVELRIDGRF